MGKKARDRRANLLADLKNEFRGRADESIIEMILEECQYDIIKAREQLDAIAEPKASEPTLPQVDLRASSGSQKSSVDEDDEEERDAFDPIDADPVFAQLRREFPESELDSAVLQLILDESRSKTVDQIRERLVVLTGYDPAKAPKKPSKKNKTKNNLSLAPVDAPSNKDDSTEGNVRVLSLSSSNGVPHTESETASFLHAMFPRLKQAYINAVVASEKGDVEKALEDLLRRFELQEAQDSSSSSSSASTSSSASEAGENASVDDIFEDMDDSEESGEEDFEDAQSEFPELSAPQSTQPPSASVSTTRRRPKKEPEPEDPLAFGEKLAILRDLFPDHTESERTSILINSNQVLAEAIDRIVSVDHPKVFHVQETDANLSNASGKKKPTKITLSLGEYYAQDEYWAPADSDAPLPLPKTAAVINMATQAKYAQLKEMFPDVAEIYILNIFAEQDYSMEATVRALHLQGHESRPLKNQHGGVVSGPHQAQTKETYRVFQGHGASQSWATRAVARPSAKSPLVEVAAQAGATGSQKAPSKSTQSYSSSDSAKRDIVELAELRNWLFRKAAQAYQCGHGALAKHFSDKGRETEHQLRTAQLLAAKQDFFEHNSTIDLHGLNVKPAISLLSELLTLHEKNARSGIMTGAQVMKRLQVITGAGNHSSGHRARIKPAVIKLLKERGYRFVEVNSGALDVFMKAKDQTGAKIS